MKDKLLEWFATSTDQGVSSKAMAKALAGFQPYCKWSSDHPRDPADFNRCLKLLKAVPEARKNMGKVALKSEVWKRLVDKWDEVEHCFLEEVGLDWEKGRDLRATRTYKMMKDLGC